MDLDTAATSSDSVPSAGVRRATTAFVLVTALLAFGVGILVIIECTQQLTVGSAAHTATSAWPYLLIVIPVVIAALVVRMHLTGAGRKRRRQP